MIVVDDKLISEDIREKQFVCDLSACKGACCIEGDAGAPLQQEETLILDEIWPKVKPYLRKESVKAVEKQGKWVKDSWGEFETPLLNGKECVYVIFEGGRALCGIEKAQREGKIDYLKPISCHLYPIRITHNSTIEVDHLNYDKWDICSPACDLGAKLKVPVYKFLKEPLIRKYGEAFYDKLEAIFRSLDKKGSED